ncbi:MAG: lactate racemase domain-containing protein [Anaerolineae bacterium]
MLTRMQEVRQSLHSSPIRDIPGVIKQEIGKSKLYDRIRPSDEIAITAGSRGIARIDEILKSIVDELHAFGAVPFLVPAMGSHGGATVEGQLEILKELNITEASLGAPIRSSMEVVQITKTTTGQPVFLDKYASKAQAIIVVGRIKPHTDFRGPIESGLSKMMTIGLGKHKQASFVHQYGSCGMRELIPQFASAIIANAPIALGIAIIEDGYHQPAVIEAVEPEEILEREVELLQEAWRLMPLLPFDALDVLVVDWIGKEISGTGMDTNVIGRLMIHGEKEFEKPRIEVIVARDLTPASHGNAVGLGLADIVTRNLVDKIDFETMYRNAITSTFLERAKIPFIAETDREAIKIALKICGNPVLSEVRMARIKSTLDLDRLYISESLVAEAVENPTLELVGKPREMRFKSSGELL